MPRSDYLILPSLKHSPTVECFEHSRHILYLFIYLLLSTSTSRYSTIHASFTQTGLTPLAIAVPHPLPLHSIRLLLCFFRLWASRVVHHLSEEDREHHANNSPLAALLSYIKQFLMSNYLFLADRHGTGSGSRWVIMGFAVKLAQSVSSDRLSVLLLPCPSIHG